MSSGLNLIYVFILVLLISGLIRLRLFGNCCLEEMKRLRLEVAKMADALTRQQSADAEKPK